MALANSITIVNPCLDTNFQHAFREKNVVAGFLKDLLDWTLVSPSDITFMDAQLCLDSTSETASDRVNFTVDLLVKFPHNKITLIQMQNCFSTDYYGKVFMEVCRFVSNVDKREEVTKLHGSLAWTQIDEIVSIVITNKKPPSRMVQTHFDEEAFGENNVINCYELMETTCSSNSNARPQHFGDVPIKFVVMCLANYNKTECVTPIDYWCYALLDMEYRNFNRLGLYRTIENLGMVAPTDALKKFYSLLNSELINRDLYEKQLNEINETTSAYFAEGEANGKLEAKLQGAANLVAKKLCTVAEACQIMEITEEAYAAYNPGSSSSQVAPVTTATATTTTTTSSNSSNSSSK